MLSHLVMQVSISILGGGVGSGCLLLLGASWYDVREIARRHDQAVATQRLRKPQQPSIAVLIYSHNNSDTLTQCLRAVTQSHYHTYDVTVIDNLSTDDSGHIVTQFQQKHPRAALRLYSKRRSAPLPQALHQAYRSSRTHDLVLVLQATDRITPQLLKQCAAQFIVQPNLGSLQLYRHHAQHYSVRSLLPRFIELSLHVLHKALPAQLYQRPQTGTFGVMYRHSEFMQHATSTTRRSHYAASLQVIDTSDDTHRPLPRRWLTSLLVWLGAALAVMLMSYLLITAMLLVSSTYLLLSWIVVSLWALSCVWTDAPMPLTEKLQLSFAAPVMFILLYLYLILHVVAVPARAATPILQKSYRVREWFLRQLANDRRIIATSTE